MNALDVVSAVLLVSGSLLCLLAGIGLHRFDSVLARMHSATKSVTLGLLLVAVGAALGLDDAGDQAKLVLIAALQFITAPVAAHVVGRAAYRSGTELNPVMALDELATEAEDDPETDGGPDQPEDGSG